MEFTDNYILFLCLNCLPYKGIKWKDQQYFHVFLYSIWMWLISLSFSSRPFLETQMQTVLYTVSFSIPLKQDFSVLCLWTGIRMAELECALKCMDAHTVSVLLDQLNEMTMHHCLLIPKLNLKVEFQA